MGAAIDFIIYFLYCTENMIYAIVARAAAVQDSAHDSVLPRRLPQMPTTERAYDMIFATRLLQSLCIVLRRE